MLRIANYTKAYGDFLVLDIPLFELERKTYWIRAENGAGKTTLLKSIAGLIPFEGEIALNGKSIRKHRIDYLSIVNYAEAEPEYPPFLTGSDLFAFYRNCKGEGYANRVMQLFGIDRYIDHKTGSYSSGMLKKLSLLFAFMGQPSLILLDEPFITLDPESQESMQELIADLSGKGISFLISSHHPLLSGHEALCIIEKSLQPLPA